MRASGARCSSKRRAETWLTASITTLPYSSQK